MGVFDVLRQASPTISVGILTANLLDLGSELSLLDGTDVRVLHFDVMDGCFCPMMTAGPPLIAAVKTPMLKDVHLMINDPLDKVGDYVVAGADLLTVHAESCTHIHRVLQVLGRMENVNHPDMGLVRGVALNPGTPVEVLEPLLDETEMVVLLGINPGWGGQGLLPSTFPRIGRVREMIEAAGREILLCVDGGIKKDNIADFAGKGVDLVVTGSAVFDGKAPAGNARFMLEALRGKSF